MRKSHYALVAFFTLVCSQSKAQIFNIVSGDAVTTADGIGLQSIGTYGSQGTGVPLALSKWLKLGVPNLGTTQPQRENMYGLLAHWNGDRIFFGLKSGDDISVETGQPERSDAVIAWGNDNVVGNVPNFGPTGPDRLIFEFHNSNTIASPAITGAAQPELEIATMLPTGEVGIGTSTPSHRLHVSGGGVRFSNLPTLAQTNVVGIDANGILYRQPAGSGGGVTLNCGSTGFLPRVSGANTLNCSIAFDNGAGSMGLAVTTNFNYNYPSTMGQYLGPNTPPPGLNTHRLKVNGSTEALAFFATSDANLKRNIRSISNMLPVIEKLQGKTYTWKESVRETHLTDPNTAQYGLIAQEVAEVVPEAVIIDEEGHYAVNYNAFIPILIEGVKELNTRYKNSEAENKELRRNIEDLQRKTTNAGTINQASSLNELFQNVPNPFKGSTTIGYKINPKAASAFILILDLNGKQLKKADIKGRESGEVSIDLSSFAPGMYLYSLVVDGNEIATKRMVLSE